MSGTRIVNLDPTIDDLSPRWSRAVHIAAHVVVARALGWIVLEGWVTDDDGGMRDRPSDSSDTEDTSRASVVIAQAGPFATRRLARLVGQPCTCPREHAEVPQDGGLERADAAREAEERVVDGWWDIIETAQQLYRAGHLA